MLYKARVYVLYLHIETNQVQSRERKIYNLHSTRQCGRIGDVVRSSLEFLNRGKLLGNDAVASRTLGGAHLRPAPLTTPASYRAQVTFNSCGIF